MSQAAVSAHDMLSQPERAAEENYLLNEGKHGMMYDSKARDLLPQTGPEIGFEWYRLFTLLWSALLSYPPGPRHWVS